MKADPVIDAQIVNSGLDAFEGWLSRHGHASYDPYDLWGTRFGILARRTYYRHGLRGLPLIAPIIAADTLVPWVRYLVVKKERFATADAQLLLACANRFETTGEGRYLDAARSLADDLLATSIPGYHGHCWGYPFDWQHSHALWRRDTPYITATPYCFEAFIRLADLTGEQRYADIARSIARFVYEDLNDTPTGPHASAGSYSPLDHSKVVNASAYRAMVLCEAGVRFNDTGYCRRGEANLQFILDCQREDGAWLYAIDLAKNDFIDHFHTCFVLKNLFKINRRLNRDDVTAAVQRGYDYYRAHLFEASGLPRSFAVKPRTQIVTLDLYNMAESITLNTLLHDTIPGALPLAGRLAQRLLQEYQLRDGHFVTKVYCGAIRQTMPFMRWSQSQLYLALSGLARHLGAH